MRKQPSTTQPKERKKFTPVKFEQTFETIQEMMHADFEADDAWDDEF